MAQSPRSAADPLAEHEVAFISTVVLQLVDEVALTNEGDRSEPHDIAESILTAVLDE